MDQINDIQYLSSQQETLIKWIKSMPLSQKKCIKNILSVNSGNGNLDKQVIKLLPNIKNYYIIQSEYDNYQNCIQNLFGNFKFKVSYSDLFDYELDPYVSYDVIVFFDGFSDVNECRTFIKCCSKFINENGKIWIFTHDDNGCINNIRNHFGINMHGDLTLKNNILDIQCKIFNTHIPTFVNVKEVNTTCLSQLLRKKCTEEDLSKFKNFVLKNYGDHIQIPISVLILSNIKKKIENNYK